MRGLVAGAAVGVLLLAGCSRTPETELQPDGPPPTSAVTTDDLDDAALDVALSEPREDSLYPDVGDPGVDALHYDLTLAWDRDTDTLTGSEVLTFRATETAERFQLDLGAPLEVSDAALDGEPVEVEHTGKDLVVQAPVVADQRYQLSLDYVGTPRPVEAPTTRGDLSTVGFTIDPDHETWTMQEPFGAYTWYAVNDQPSDKALYDFDLTAPDGWSGIANGELTSREGSRSTFHLAEPASSYLVTLAFGDYDLTEDTGPGGVPIDFWIPASDPELLAGPRTAPAAMRFLERYLGPYPFETAGILVVDSESGMETQTMITLGDTEYSTSPAVVVHEFAHQWYGDQVTPADWRDVWMNEGMATYLQLMWEAEQQGTPLDRYLQPYLAADRAERREAGPPGDFDPDQFGSSNVYYGPALMWHEIRGRLGDEEFFRLVRGWPASQDNRATGRDTLIDWWSEQSGEDLRPLFEAWLLSPTTPERA